MVDVSQLNPDFDTTLRPYQTKYKKQIYRLWEEHRSIMLQMPTGTGKTRVFTSIIKDIHNLSIAQKKAIKVLVLVHRQELVEQASETLGFRYNIAHGVIMSRYWQQKKLPMQIASVQTLVRRLPKWEKKDFDFIIIDEAHHALAKSYQQICSTFPSARILGVTATPYRMNGASFRSVFDAIVISEPIEYYIKQKYLSEYEYYSIPPTSRTQLLIDSIKEFDVDGDYSVGAMMRVVDTRRVRADILKAYNTYARGKKGIVYTINKQHNQHVCQLYLDEGIPAAYIDSDTKKEDREALIEKFKAGKIQVLCNVNIFSEGFDCPDIEFIQLARPTASLSLFLQQVGRGLRIHPDVEKVVFLDNVGSYNKFGLPSQYRDWQSYFDGDYHTADQNSNLEVANLSASVIFIEDIEEGDEDVFLLYSSKDTNETGYDEIVDYPVILQDENHATPVTKWIPSFYYSELVELLGPLDDDDKEWNLIENVQKVREGNSWGLYDTQEKRLITPVQFDEIEEPNFKGFARCKRLERYGLINVISGEVVIEAQYDIVEDMFYGNLLHYYLVGKDGKQGVLEDTGSEIVPLKFDEVLAEEAFINLRIGNYWVVFDLESEDLIEKFEKKKRLNSFDMVALKEYFGLAEIESGFLVTPMTYDEIKYENGFYIASRRPTKGFTNNYYVWTSELDWVFKGILGGIEFVSNEFLKIKDYWEPGSDWLNGYGLANKKGEIIVPPAYESLDMYEDKLVVRKDSEWQIIDYSGKTLFRAKKKKEVIEQYENSPETINPKNEDNILAPKELQKPQSSKRGKRPRIKVKGSKKIP